MSPLALITLFTQNPEGLGRIVRDESHQLIAIVEELDTTEEQKGINEVNSGILVASAIELKDWLTRLSNENSQGEYYLTDVVAMAVADGHSVESMTTGDEYEVQGVNDKLQLCMLERHFQMIQAQALLATGVTVMDPTRVDIRGDHKLRPRPDDRRERRDRGASKVWQQCIYRRELYRKRCHTW